MAEHIKKEYSNGDITITWEPHKCIHSKKCIKGLPQVFDFERRPWILADGSSSESISKQIDSCPSGALGYYYPNKEKDVSAQVSDPHRIEVSQNGPLLVFGKLHIKTTSGELEKDGKVTAFCRCGGSGNKPFCDGTHQKINFKG